MFPTRRLFLLTLPTRPGLRYSAVGLVICLTSPCVGETSPTYSTRTGSGVPARVFSAPPTRAVLLDTGHTTGILRLVLVVFVAAESLHRISGPASTSPITCSPRRFRSARVFSLGAVLVALGWVRENESDSQ